MDVEFGLQRGSQKGSLGESNYVSQLKRRLRFAHQKAKHMAKRQQARHWNLYDLKCRGATLEEGDLVLVKQTAWKGRDKIQDRWESRELPGGVPAYPWCPSIYSQKVLLEAGLGSYIGTYCCLCKVGSGSRVGQRERASQALRMRRRAEVRCPRWLGLLGRSLGEPPTLCQAPPHRGRPLW